MCSASCGWGTWCQRSQDSRSPARWHPTASGWCCAALHSAAPTQDSAALTQGNAAPTQGNPAPTQDSAAPAQDSAAFTQGSAAPTQNSPAPTQGNPAPTQDSPAPTQGNPAPTQGNPAPTQGNAASTQDGAAPTPGSTVPRWGRQCCTVPGAPQCHPPRTKAGHTMLFSATFCLCPSTTVPAGCLLCPVCMPQLHSCVPCTKTSPASVEWPHAMGSHFPPEPEPTLMSIQRHLG